MPFNSLALLNSPTEILLGVLVVVFFLGVLFVIAYLIRRKGNK